MAVIFNENASRNFLDFLRRFRITNGRYAAPENFQQRHAHFFIHFRRLVAYALKNFFA